MGIEAQFYILGVNLVKLGGADGRVGYGIHVFSNDHFFGFKGF